MKEITLTQGKVALVDDDYEYLNQFKWCANKIGGIFYAVRGIRVNGKCKTILMHVVIMGGKGIDHRDHNGLNNQKSNLRFCSQSENCMNRRKQANTSSIHKGVCFFKRDNNWLAQIQGKDGKLIYLGYFTDEVEAGEAYNKAAIELYGEYACLNTFN